MEGRRHLLNVVDGDIALGALDGADIGPVEAADIGEGFLAEAALFPKPAHIGGHHTPKLTDITARHAVDVPVVMRLDRQTMSSIIGGKERMSLEGKGRDTGGYARLIRNSGLAALAAVAGVGLYFTGKGEGFADGVAARSGLPGSADVAPSVPKTGTSGSPRSSQSPEVAEAFHAAYGMTSPAMQEVGGLSYSYEPALIDGAQAVVPVGKFRVFVSTGVADVQQADHSAPGFVSLHYFNRNKGRLQLASAFPNAVAAGSFGSISGLELRTDLLPSPTLVVTGGGTVQGCSWLWADVVELTPDGPLNRARVLVGRDMNEVALTGRLIPVGGGFAVSYGEAPDETIRYEKRGEKYVPTTAEPEAC